MCAKRCASRWVLRRTGAPCAWTETATHAAVIDALDDEDFDLVILDGEAAKSGGMGICRQIKHELYTCPPVLLLVGRPGDAWLATWSEADAAVAHPLDPFVVREASRRVLRARGRATRTAHDGNLARAVVAARGAR